MQSRSLTPIESVYLVRDPEEAATLLQRDRLRLVCALNAPASGAELARRLGLPRQRVNYHLRELEKEGLVQLVEARRRGSVTARVVRARARSYLVSPEALGRLGDHVPQGEGESTMHRLLSMVSRVIRDVGMLRSRAAVEGEGAETLAIQTDLNFPTPQARQAFARELSHMVGELTSRYRASEGGDGQETFRLTIGGYDVE